MEDPEQDLTTLGAGSGAGREDGPEVKRLALTKIEMARPKRFELLTPRFVVWCSIQLSYGR